MVEKASSNPKDFFQWIINTAALEDRCDTVPTIRAHGESQQTIYNTNCRLYIGADVTSERSPLSTEGGRLISIEANRENEEGAQTRKRRIIISSNTPQNCRIEESGCETSVYIEDSNGDGRLSDVESGKSYWRDVSCVREEGTQKCTISNPRVVTDEEYVSLQGKLREAYTSWIESRGKR